MNGAEGMVPVVMVVVAVEDMMDTAGRFMINMKDTINRSGAGIGTLEGVEVG